MTEKPEEKKEEVVEPVIATPAGSPGPEETITVSRAEFDRLKEFVYGTADKGRAMSFEKKQTPEKKPFRVNLSRYAGGYITGWKTVNDDKVFNPTTGKQVGEVYTVELAILKPDGITEVATVSGYKKFDDVRYADRVDCEVVGRSEDYDGTTKFKVQLPDNRVIDLDARFVN